MNAQPEKPTAPVPIDPRSTALAALTEPEHARWVGWRFEYRAGKNGKPGKWTKPPRSANGGYAKNNDPNTWSPFEAIWRGVIAGKYEGLGVVLLGLPGAVLAAIDLDDIRDPATGALVPWAAKIVADAGSYTEITPSRCGLRVLGTVNGIDKLHRRKDPHPDGAGGFELYCDCERYITFTGQRLEGAPHTLNDITAVMRELCALCDAPSGGPTAGSKPNGAAGPDHTAPPPPGAAAGGAADPIDLEALSLSIIELLTTGTVDGKPVRARGKKFFALVQYLHRKGFSFASVLATLNAHPAGVHAKYIGRLETELQRAWNKLPPANTLPTIAIIGGKRHEAANAGLAALAAAGVPFYRRGKDLVRVARIKAKTASGATVVVPSIIPVSAAILSRALGQFARWEKYKADGEISVVDPPDDVVEQIAAMIDWWPFPPLRGVIATQTMRYDGTLLIEPGYDAATGLVLFDPPPMPAIPDQPTKADALEALALLRGLLDEVDFAEDAGVSLSSAVSMIMSPVLRGMMATAPMHVVTKPAPGTGGSYMQDIVAAIALGERCPVLSLTLLNAEENEKRLSSAALTGQPIIAIDNFTGTLMGDFLCQLIERPMPQVRLLGRSVLVTIANNHCVVANGNNVTIGADTVRRTVQIALDANVENPESRSFSRNPVAEVLADRGKYIGAILTIARAWRVAGMPGKLAPRLSFEEWSDNVRSPLVWLNWPDPDLSIQTVRAADPIGAQLHAVITAWADELHAGFGYFTSELVEHASQYVSGSNTRVHPALWEALFAIAGNRFGQLDPRALGRWLEAHLNRVVANHKLVVDRTNKARPRWKLASR